MKQKLSKKTIQMLVVGTIAIGLAVWFFIIVPMRRKKQQEEEAETYAPNPQALAQAQSKPKNNTPRFPIVWLEYNPNTLTLQQQLNVYAAKFTHPTTKAKVNKIAEDGYLGPETAGLLAVWFPGIAKDVTTSKTLSNAQFAILMNGPAVAPITAKTL
ncbi:hypothetical protein QNI19_16465 [Cytophagaceae bacterium DM2B3-1]|uniref:Uncharacterized protein n=1 Tax=Xanthocytophaga flava TaxID=3048013 RepID=A0ABT7CNF6_9BACT|nr:hypothetical protein [Xanthocytophaga flavus]MDJ1494540.1 hypothetical protein [Xanthocytophaga flavus]